MGVPTVNPKEYAAAVPDNPPESTVVTVKLSTSITVIVPLKLSAFAFLTLTILPFERP